MWFTDPTDTSTIAVLLVEVALLGLAVAAALGILVRPVRWLGRCLAAFSALVALLGFGEVVWELWTFRYPLVLPQAPFGTYAQPTVIGLPRFCWPVSRSRWPVYSRSGAPVSPVRFSSHPR